MNVYLKSAVQNLDCVITDLTEMRAKLMSLLGGGVQTIEPLRMNLPPAVPLAPPPESTVPRPKSPVKTGKRNGGGRPRKTEAGSQRTEGSAPVAPAAPVIHRAGPTPAAPGERAKTLGGAMKLIVGAMGTFTREAVREALQKDYGSEEFVKDASASAFPANISYWLKNGKLEENAAGVLKVVDKEFFGSVEFK
jgi:hypothetical protein